MAIDVFLSVGRTFTDAQEQFVTDLERLLADHELQPHALGRSDYSAAQPLRAIEELMDRCSGSVIVAFERLFVERGVDQRGGPKQRDVSAPAMTTVWNQIEAAMAYVKRQPLLVIVEEGVIQQGLLSHGHDWHVQQLPLSRAELRSRETIGRLEEWKARVVAYSEATPKQRAPLEPDKMSVAQLVGAVKPAQLWGAVGAAGSLLAAAFLAGRQLP